MSCERKLKGAQKIAVKIFNNKTRRILSRFLHRGAYSLSEWIEEKIQLNICCQEKVKTGGKRLKWKLEILL